MANAMTTAEAVAWVSLEAQVTSQPCLDAAEVEHLVRRARRADAERRSPSDAAWVPTFDLAWAVWQAWKAKAGKAVTMVDVMADGAQVAKSQVVKHCLAMAAEAARSVGGASVLVTDHRAMTSTDDLADAADDAVAGLNIPGSIPGVTYP